MPWRNSVHVGKKSRKGKLDFQVQVCRLANTKTDFVTESKVPDHLLVQRTSKRGIMPEL